MQEYVGKRIVIPQAHVIATKADIIEGIQVVSIASIASKSLTPEPLISTTMERLSLILNKSGLETLGALDVDGLDVRVELLGGSLLVVTLAGDADAKSEWASLDTGLPDLLVQLWVDADISGTLDCALVCCRIGSAYLTVFRGRICAKDMGSGTMDFLAKALISLMAFGARFLNETPWSCE